MNLQPSAGYLLISGALAAFLLFLYPAAFSFRGGIVFEWYLGVLTACGLIAYNLAVYRQVGLAGRLFLLACTGASLLFLVFLLLFYMQLLR